jgi:hypothetical protein
MYDRKDRRSSSRLEVNIKNEQDSWDAAQIRIGITIYRYL